MLLDRPGHDPQVLAARAAVVADPATTQLLGRLPNWEADQRLSGHDSPPGDGGNGSGEWPGQPAWRWQSATVGGGGRSGVYGQPGTAASSAT